MSQQLTSNNNNDHNRKLRHLSKLSSWTSAKSHQYVYWTGMAKTTSLHECSRSKGHPHKIEQVILRGVTAVDPVDLDSLHHRRLSAATGKNSAPLCSFFL